MAPPPPFPIPRGTAVRPAAAGIAFLSLLAVSIGAVAADEAPLRAVEIPGYGTVRFPVPPEWEVSEPVIAESNEGEEGSAGPRAASFQVSTGSPSTMNVAVAWTELPDPSFNGPGTLRALVDRMARAALDEAIESRYTLREMRGPAGGGYAFTLRARVPRRKSESYLTSGAFGLGNLLLRFTFLSPQPDPPEAADALELIAGARLDEEPPPAP